VKTMEWDDLKHFLAVARLGTLTRAAHALQTTPATVARRVANLETSWNSQLFTRKYTGYTLTEAGKALLARTEEVEGAISAMRREALRSAAHAAGQVRVTTTEDIATLVLSPRLVEFARRFPQVQLEILATREVVSLARGDADIALRTVRPARGGLVIRQAGVWNLGLYAAKGYAQAHNLRPGVSDLSGVDIITWTKEHAHLRGGPWLAEHARNANVAFTANARRVHYAACKAGMGVAILPSLLADADDELIRLLPAERVISARLWLLAHRDVVRVPRVRAVMNFLAEIGPRHSRQR
jgi:DNA-binding transcriptional LysR family regulator